MSNKNARGAVLFYSFHEDKCIISVQFLHIGVDINTAELNYHYTLIVDIRTPGQNMRALLY